MWGSRTSDNRGHDLLDFLVNSGLDVVNRGTEPTFSNSRGETLIDITVCTPNLNDLIQNWRVSYEDSLSDHKYIHFSLEGSGHGPEYSRNPRNTDWEGYANSLGDLIKQFPRRYGTPEEIELAVEAVERAVMDSYEANCHLKLKCQKKGDVWFNKDLDDQKKKVRTLKWKQRRNCAFREEYLNSLTSFKNKVRKARLSSWRDFCGGVEGFLGTTRLLRVRAGQKWTAR